MPTPIHTAFEIHNVPTSEAYADRHRRKIAERAFKAGVSIEITESTTPKVAYINHARWVIDCDCAAGCAVDTEAEVARCGECGTIHTNVVLPANRTAIEAVLTKRRRTKWVNWYPTETVAKLQSENVSHGSRDVEDP